MKQFLNCINCKGDWLISITSNKRQIKGSPFTVRVYDGSKVRVYGIEGGENGLPVKFTGLKISVILLYIRFHAL